MASEEVEAIIHDDGTWECPECGSMRESLDSMKMKGIRMASWCEECETVMNRPESSLPIAEKIDDDDSSDTVSNPLDW